MQCIYVIYFLTALSMANPIAGELFTDGVCHSPSSNTNSFCTPTSQNRTYPLPVNAAVNCSCMIDGKQRAGAIVYPTGELYTIRSCNADGSWSGTSPICVLNLTKIVQYPVLVRGHEIKELQIANLTSRGEFERININSSVINFDVKLRQPAAIHMLQLNLKWSFVTAPSGVRDNEWNVLDYEMNWNEKKSIPQFIVRIPDNQRGYESYTLRFSFFEVQSICPIYDIHMFDHEGHNLDDEGVIQNVIVEGYLSKYHFKYENGTVSAIGGKKLFNPTYYFYVLIGLTNKTRLHSIHLDLDKPFDLKFVSPKIKSLFYSNRIITKEEIGIVMTLAFQDPMEDQSNINLTLEFNHIRNIARLDVFGHYNNTDDCLYPEKNEISLLEVTRNVATGRFLRATYNCPVDYQVEGTSTRDCLTDGQWSQKPPTCVKVISHIEVYIVIGAESLSVLLLTILVVALMIWKRRRSRDTAKDVGNPPSVRTDFRQTSDEDYADAIPNRPSDGAIGWRELKRGPSYQYEDNELYGSTDQAKGLCGNTKGPFSYEYEENDLYGSADQ